MSLSPRYFVRTQSPQEADVIGSLRQDSSGPVSEAPALSWAESHSEHGESESRDEPKLGRAEFQDEGVTRQMANNHAGRRQLRQQIVVCEPAVPLSSHVALRKSCNL